MQGVYWPISGAITMRRSALSAAIDGAAFGVATVAGRSLPWGGLSISGRLSVVRVIGTVLHEECPHDFEEAREIRMQSKPFGVPLKLRRDAVRFTLRRQLASVFGQAAVKEKGITDMPQKSGLRRMSARSARIRFAKTQADEMARARRTVHAGPVTMFCISSAAPRASASLHPSGGQRVYPSGSDRLFALMKRHTPIKAWRKLIMQSNMRLRRDRTSPRRPRQPRVSEANAQGRYD